jgi:hypothetical protein
VCRTAWQAWREKNGSAIVDLGMPLQNSITVAGGSLTPGKTSITGYTFLQAGSMDEAAGLIGGHPHLRVPGSSVEILECVAMPGVP